MIGENELLLLVGDDPGGDPCIYGIALTYAVEGPGGSLVFREVGGDLSPRRGTLAVFTPGAGVTPTGAWVQADTEGLTVERHPAPLPHAIAEARAVVPPAGARLMPHTLSELEVLRERYGQVCDRAGALSLLAVLVTVGGLTPAGESVASEYLRRDS